ncbi:MAG: ferredoxin--NADP(+) reductase [Pirellulaceae bacterium]|nr:MAG: ferredoxin--NADP(+) reductase [Pirellulaceae bacterium]
MTSSPTLLPASEVELLRLENYNATVIGIRRCHDELMVLRVRPDRGLPYIVAGQYTVLGLGYWEDRVPGAQEEGDISRVVRKVVKRAYSISCPILDEGGRLVSVNDLDYMEFYVVLVRRSDERPPALTPRLFRLTVGDRLFCGPHVYGNYTLARVPLDANVVFFATGTGEAPHNAMIAQLLKTGQRGRIVHVTSVRWKKDLGYLAVHRELERRFANYRYQVLTTREPENLDPSHPNYSGKMHIQDYVASGRFENDMNLALDPDTTHVFLCGNPAMIGAPVRTQAAQRRYAVSGGMVELLEKRGFQIDQPHESGNIHFESYW